MAMANLRQATAVRLQAWWRCFRARRAFQEACRAILRIQTATRGHQARRLFEGMRRCRAALRLQSFARGRRARVVYWALLRNVVLMQRRTRGRRDRNRYMRTLQCIVRLQRWGRCKLLALAPKMSHRRICRSVGVIQRWWRGCRGRRTRRLMLANLLRLRRALRRALPILQQATLNRLRGQGGCARAAIGRGTATVGELLLARGGLRGEIEAMKRRKAAMRRQRDAFRSEIARMESLSLSGILLGGGCSGGDRHSAFLNDHHDERSCM